jgi:hypothetical protein
MSNARMMFQDGTGYQERTHARLNAALARGELFVAFLTTYPRFTINHSVLIYKLKSSSPNPGVDRYLVYDPNHPESPRELTWSAHDRAFSYQKDWDFVGGLFAFIRFTANRCSKSDSLTRVHARESVSAQTNSAAPCASTRTIAAESIAGAAGSDVAVAPMGDASASRFPQGSGYSFYFGCGNKKRSAGSTLAAQGCFAVIGALDLEVS